MISTLSTLSSICEDALVSITTRQCDMQPLNRELLDDIYLEKVPVVLQDHSDATSPLIPNSTTNLKQLFRMTLLHATHPRRASLWFHLLRLDPSRAHHKFRQAVDRYPEDIRNMFGRRNDIAVRLPSCVDVHHLPNYHLNQAGQHAVTRILGVFAYYHPDITWAPLLGPLVALLLHYMTEINAYESLLILTSEYKIITQTEIQYQSLTLAFCTLFRRHCRSTYDTLIKQQPQQQQSHLFDDWLWLIFDHLPFEYIVPIVDCLFVEGIKVLIRISMALFNFFVKFGLHQSKQQQRQTASVVKRRRDSIFRRATFTRSSSRTSTPTSLSSMKTNTSVHDAFIHFVEHFDVPIEKFFKSAFAIPNLKRKEILRTIEAEEQKVRLERRRILPQLSSTGDHLVSQQGSTTKLIPARVLHHQNSLPIIMIREFDTTTASHSDFAYLWSLLPSRLADFQPERLYSSHIHGLRLRTLYDHVEFHEHCFVIIRNENQDVFGGFCAGQLALRSTVRKTWFGTGESFLFTLKPEREVFKWVGNQSARGSTYAYEDYFIYADDECLKIGGSKEPLDIGLCIQQDLCSGSTRRCDTFASRPLSSSEHFPIMEIEVFGFTR